MAPGLSARSLSAILAVIGSLTGYQEHSQRERHYAELGQQSELRGRIDNLYELLAASRHCNQSCPAPTPAPTASAPCPAFKTPEIRLADLTWDRATGEDVITYGNW